MKVPILNAKELRKILEKLGFALIRQKGSHMFFRDSNGTTTVIPNHPNTDINKDLLNKIIKKDLRLSKEEFIDLCNKLLIL